MIQLRRQLASHCEGLTPELKEVRKQAEKAIDGLPDLVANEVTKATSRKKTDVKDEVDDLLGSPSLMLRIAMAMLEHEKVFNTFKIFTKRQVEIASSQSMGNAAESMGFRQNPILGKPLDY